MNPHPIIVVADPEPLILELMQEALADAGYPTVLTTDPQHTHPVVLHHHPDVVILEIAPETIGWPALERIKRDPRTAHIPILVCSSDKRLLITKKEKLALHNCSCLEKPFLLEDLLAALTPLIGPPPEAPLEHH